MDNLDEIEMEFNPLVVHATSGLIMVTQGDNIPVWNVKKFIIVTLKI